MSSHIIRHGKQLPEALRHALVRARHEREWSQAELGRRVGLPQMHISSIESGRVVPRFDTLLDLVRVLGYDLVLVPREVVPVVHALLREHEPSHEPRSEAAVRDDQPLYRPDEEIE